MTTSKGQRYLGIAFFLTLAFCIVEYIGGKISGSLALVADAGHMLADLSALGIAYFAGWIAEKRANHKMTFGYYRVEVLAALVNGAILLTIAISLCRQAWSRVFVSYPIQSGIMIGVAALGLAVNLVVGSLLIKHRRDSINIGAAFYHVFSDALSSLGTVMAGIAVALTGWVLADSIVSLMIALMIAVSAWRLLKSVVAVLMEATPSHIDIAQLEARVLAVSGVKAVHDLHVWSLAPGKESLSAHIEVNENVDRDVILDQVRTLFSREFKITHTTLQIEKSFGVKHDEDHFHA